jgi:hypothetical protein
MLIKVPDEIYEEFCVLLDAGVQFVTDANETAVGHEIEFTDAEKRCIEFVENREWEK